MKRMQMGWLALAGVGTLTLTLSAIPLGFGRAQETPPAANPPTGQEFQAVFEDWKSLLKEMRDLRMRFLVADPKDTPAMTQQWTALVTKGNELLPRLRDAAIKAYVAAPEQDPQIARFLTELAGDALAGDRYEEVLLVAQPLIDHKTELKKIYDLAGQAAFCLDQFTTAEQYLTEAQAAGAISDTGSQSLVDAKTYKALWEEEQALREAEAAKDDLPRVRLQTTKGEIVVELFEDSAPDTVGNFVNLVDKGFYNGLNFHRVLANFMAQAGCPNGDGSGGPGYEIYDEVGLPGARMHFRGTLSMAKTDAPDSGGSQFFLTFRPTSHLNGRHTVFGRVLTGFEVLEKLQRRNPDDPAAAEPDKIIKAEVVRKRDHEYLPKKVGG